MGGFYWIALLLLLTSIQCSEKPESQNDLILVDAQPEQNDKTLDDPIVVKSPKIYEPFHPTDQWQVVHGDQPIPAGLHVRMNFQTGVKEAKLMDGDDGSRFKKERGEENTGVKDKFDAQTNSHNGPNIVISEEQKPIQDFPSDNNKVYFTKNDLKNAMKDFRDKIGTNDINMEVDDEEQKRQESTKKKFRPIEEIRAELEDQMGWKIKSDFESMKDHLLAVLQDNVTDSLKMDTLDSLEDYVHQIDNARDLDKIDGYKVLNKLLNSSSDEIKEKAANVIAAAVQSNPAAQSAALSQGVLVSLLRLLSKDHVFLVRKKAFYALSALVRNHAEAQKEFVAQRGLEIVDQILEDKEAGKLRIKAMTLLYDLIVEQQGLIEEMIKKNKKKEGQQSPILNALTKHGWCEDLLPLLKIDDYDSKEKVLQAMTVSRDICRTVYDSSSVDQKLRNFRMEMKKAIESEEDEDFRGYLTNLKQMVDALLKGS